MAVQVRKPPSAGISDADSALSARFRRGFPLPRPPPGATRRARSRLVPRSGLIPPLPPAFRFYRPASPYPAVPPLLPGVPVPPILPVRGPPADLL
jgi:hypothetical protein